ncbi:MAG TPA: hypothetical protein VHN14_29435 [Kofleriaceae bacterium]|nr:hypothetical protein [Kofleriaceae bacterium]
MSRAKTVDVLDQLGDPRPPRVDLRGARLGRRAWRERRVRDVANLGVGRKQCADGVATD